MSRHELLIVILQTRTGTETLGELESASVFLSVANQ